MSKDLTENFRAALAKEPATNINRIDSSRCGSGQHDGVEYEFYGDYIPIRPIIDVLAEQDGHAIEHIHFVNDGEEPWLGVFVANITERTHPAFTN